MSILGIAGANLTGNNTIFLNRFIEIRNCHHFLFSIMKRNSVKVCVRTKPTQYFAQDNFVIDEEHSTIQISTSQGEEPTPGLLNNKKSCFKFKFDHVFHNASQSAVYDLYARDTVQNVVDGTNGAIMTYGQTGSGKTFTMMGDTSNYEHRGIAPRALAQLFSEVNSRIEFEYKISCTYMEIYNERIFDLLTDLSNPNQASDYTIAEEKDGRGTFVRGLTEVEVKSETETFNLLYSGELARTTATHKLNRRSNRSHSIFTIYVEQRQRSGVSERVVHSKLHLVDLAGSERLKKTMGEMDAPGSEVTRRESMGINQSLTFLEQCVVALARRGQTHIPYRQSKLTNILKDCLGANCNTIMLSCIWGEADHLEETVSTLRLASRMMRVQNETSTVETVDTSALIRKQAKIIKALKQELLMHDALVERTGVGYEPYTPEQQSSVAQMLEKYVDTNEADEEDVLTINSFRQMLEVCKQFKRMVLSARSEARGAREDALLGLAAAGGAGRPMSSIEFGSNSSSEFAADSRIVHEFDPKAPMVGEAEEGRRLGFSLGVAAADARPSTGVEGVSSRFEHKGDKNNFILAKPTAPGGSPGRKSLKTAKFEDGSPDSRTTRGYGPASDNQLSGGQSALFESYTRSEGALLYQDFVDAKVLVKEQRQRSKDTSVLVNEAKGDIDRLQEQVELRKNSRIELLRRSGLKSSETEDIVDEEEFSLMKDLREAKRGYKNAYEQMQKLKTTTAQTQAKVESLKSQLASGFAEWNSLNMSAAGANRGLGARTSSFDNAGDGNADQLDDQEAFDRLELERVLSSDPDSLAFFNAQKTRRAHMTQNGGNIRQITKSKRQK